MKANTNKVALILSILCLCLALPSFADTQAAETHGMSDLLASYETIRLSLLEDRWDGADEAAVVHGAIAQLTTAFDAEAAGVAAESQEKAVDLLAKMKPAGEALAAAADLESARTAFYELTKNLVLYRELMTGDKPAVAYCPMAKKSWLQPKGEIGNPYHGQSMPKCGTIVSE